MLVWSLFYGFGSNDSQQQGYKSTAGCFAIAPVFVPSLSTLFENIQITQITTGYAHSLFLTSNGKVYGCGSNESGQLGIDRDGILEPQIIPSL